MRRDGVNRLTAMETIVREEPSIYEAYQAAGKMPSDLGLRPENATAT
jgi:hypothetical protein